MLTTVDRMFDDMMHSAFGAATNARSFRPEVDIHTTDQEVRLLFDVPGIKQEDLDVSLHNHVLTVKGTRKFEGKAEEQVVLGRSYGAFTRSYTLPDGLDEEKLSANLADGVLTLIVPKLPRAKPIKIQVSSNKTLKE